MSTTFSELWNTIRALETPRLAASGPVSYPQAHALTISGSTCASVTYPHRQQALLVPKEKPLIENEPKTVENPQS
jgi:hypothetical protein